MSDLIDKKALIDALTVWMQREHSQRCVNKTGAESALYTLLHRINTGEFDAKPEIPKECPLTLPCLNLLTFPYVCRGGACGHWKGPKPESHVDGKLEMLVRISEVERQSRLKQEQIDDLKKRVGQIEKAHNPGHIFNEKAEAWIKANKSCPTCRHLPEGAFGITTRCIGCAATNFRNWECKS